ncbi:hypothetical protein P4464_001010 [Salmonella enterica]|uniref:DGQHR domain-containing protein n=1 Tax=Salmonella enterica TaxID=28901 RepID=A0A742ZJP1_SALER|nr:hypothetical protein [Salmonella enterica subsp. enterica serovar Enteritidis]EAU2556095.1 hypothetical protein [Salmonella enterica]EKQ3556516.1 hypothetical protein [Salmonella enterica]HAF1612429.1 hypothetical protein [Salmonella enterica]
MEMLEFEYDAVILRQTETSKPIILFGAPAVDIETWAGIPQKKTFLPDGAESSGFQRVENQSRLEQIRRFYLNESNVIQNSLICALRGVNSGKVVFKSEPDSVVGKVQINFPNLYSADYLFLFSLLRQSLESRLGKYNQPIDNVLFEKLKGQLSRQISNDDPELEQDDYLETENETESVILEETHLHDFLRDVVIRHEILKDIDPILLQNMDKFLGFDREALLSFLLPVTLVDGQHRLKGAIIAAKQHIQNDKYVDMIAERVFAGEEPTKVENDVLRHISRKLPVSLLMDDDPKEQVFQFVVINQKATPIGKSLLGTIISTSLTNDEMSLVSNRLRDSGILLEEARAITWAARNPESPFCGLVERGMQTDKKGLLQWNVMGSLIQIFRNLNGGCLFHSKVDYARTWRDNFLESSGLVESDGFDDAYEKWRALDGVWKVFFVIFWKRIRDIFGDVTDNTRFNYWGNTRRSNLFNKISLTILAADFFRYLCVADITLDNEEQINSVIDGWLQRVNPKYFDRDWELAGVKKDSTGIRAKWSELWTEYRDSKGGALPQVKSYRQAKK